MSRVREDRRLRTCMAESRASTQIDGGMCACNRSIHMVSFMVQMSCSALPFCGEVDGHERHI
jgi:hypothetical protein